MQNVHHPEEAVSAGASWRRDAGGVVLVGRRCQNCGKRAFTRSAYCDVCQGEDFAPEDLGSLGTLYSFSEVHIAPRQFATPYVIGYVDIGDDVRIFTQIENPARDLKVGDTVHATAGPIRTDEAGQPVEGYKFCLGGKDDA